MTTRARVTLAAVGGAALLPVLLPHPFVLTIATQAVIWALLAASWDLLSGYTGQISFGHAGFFALGPTRPPPRPSTPTSRRGSACSWARRSRPPSGS